MDRVVALDVLAQTWTASVFISGVGTKACRALGIPLDFTVLRTSGAKTCTCTPTVGIPYCDSMSTTWPETSGAQPGQVPTPMMAASPSCPDARAQLGVWRVLVAPADDLGLDRRPVLLEPAVQLGHEVVGVREADVDEEDLLPVELVEARSHPARAHLRRIALGVQHPEPADMRRDLVRELRSDTRLTPLQHCAENHVESRNEIASARSSFNGSSGNDASIARKRSSAPSRNSRCVKM